MRLIDVEDTVIAVSSPPGAGPRSVLRISGPEAFPIGRQLLACDWPAVFPVRVAGRLRLPEAPLPAVAYLFAGPRSYTGQDVVELHVAGSPILVDMVLEAAHRLGARTAGPGEFTARAYLAGKMSLVEAEAVAAVIAAQTDQQLRAAEGLLHGRLTRAASHCQSELADLLALVEAGIDFTEEDIEFASPAETADRLAAARRQLEQLLDSSVRQERLDALPRVLLAGPPNVGKSSLLNRLTGVDRAICSPVAGTTRDVLSAPLSLPHGDCLILDAAGIGADSGDPIDSAARAAAIRAAAECDLVCLVLDPANGGAGGRPPFDKLAPDMTIVNKVDLIPPDRRPAVLGVSALTGEGLDELERRLDARLFEQGQVIRGDVLALSARHRDAIGEAIAALARAESLVLSGDVGELPALEIREAIDQLAALAGEIPTDEILGRIFSRFCVGK